MCQESWHQISIVKNEKVNGLGPGGNTAGLNASVIRGPYVGLANGFSFSLGKQSHKLGDGDSDHHHFAVCPSWRKGSA